MKFCKSIFLIIFLSTNIDASSINKEYKIEFLIFKYTETNSQENFETLLTEPSTNSVINYDNESKNSRFSYFSNISTYFENITSKNKTLISNTYPKIFFRDDDEINILKKIEKNILNDKNKILLDSKSWIQTIPKYDDSKYLSYKDNKNYGFYIKFYQKRFMHIDLIGFLDEKNNRYNKFINIEKRVFNEDIYFFDHPYFGMLISINEI